MPLERRVFRPRPVSRPDAGGSLWAPVDQHNQEHGITPSYDAAAIRRFCDRLNTDEGCEGANSAHP